MFEYRQATKQDIDILVKLRIEFLKEAENISNSTLVEELRKNLVNYFKENLSNQFIAWLATVNGVIVATSGITFYSVPPLFENTEGNEAYIMNMYTLPKYRRKGIGTTLLQKLIDEAKKRKIVKIRLITTDDGRSLYNKYGFKDSKDEMVLVLSKLHK